MNLSVYAVAFNEEKIMPFFLDYYSQFVSKITIYDNESTDNTVSIVNNYKKCETEVILFHSENSMNDYIHRDIKNKCWKDSNSDYTIVVDCDEFIYHPNLVEFLTTTKQALYCPIGYQMVSEKFPEYNKLITDQIKNGTAEPMYSKPCLFSPRDIKRCHYSIGAHTAKFTSINDEVLSPYTNNELKCLHYKNISYDYRSNKNKRNLNRMQDTEVIKKIGMHYDITEDQALDEFKKLLKESKEII